MHFSPQQPIGIYDSGVGGLTVARIIAKMLPHENIVYYGDTAHLPYGEKSETAIRLYSSNIVKFLIDQQCKMIVIACHSASSSCADMLLQNFGHTVHIINVIDPMITLLKQKYYNKKIGLIGTKRTIQSQAYQQNKEISSLAIHALATPLLAPMIEEQFISKQISRKVITAYLSHPTLSKIDCLALACTHYPLIKEEINSFYNHKIPLLDPSEIIVHAVNYHLRSKLLLNNRLEEGSRSFFVSDYTSSFETCVKYFFGKMIPLQQKII